MTPYNFRFSKLYFYNEKLLISTHKEPQLILIVNVF